MVSMFCNTVIQFSSLLSNVITMQKSCTLTMLCYVMLCYVMFSCVCFVVFHDVSCMFNVGLVRRQNEHEHIN
jgi:hypothetical protein